MKRRRNSLWNTVGDSQSAAERSEEDSHDTATRRYDETGLPFLVGRLAVLC